MIDGRRPFQGALQIIAYNWSFYLLGLIAAVVGIGVLSFVRLPFFLVILGCLGIGIAMWWWLASIVASYWVYDASPLMQWRWLDSLAARSGSRWINFHAGLDESTPQLTALWGPPIDVFDFFDDTEMTEKSIHRARALAKNEVAPTPTAYKSLPLKSNSVDAIVVPFAAHELRSRQARDAFFSELARVLASKGRLTVVEHTRDLANFVVYGPGFMHFFPMNEWRRCGEGAGLRLTAERTMTPFVRAFVWEKP